MRISTSNAIILGAIIASIILTVGAKLVGASFWGAFGAISTFAAVIWAIFHQGILQWYQCPKVLIDSYEEESPYFRSVPTGTPEEPVKSYILTFKIINTGESIAEKAQPLLTRVWSREDRKWKPQPGWVPVPLRWVFDEIAREQINLQIPTEKGFYKWQSSGKPTEEKDLVQHRPYLFNLGELSTRHPETFDLLGIIFSRSQQNSFGPGEHCFEITVFSQKVDPQRKYVYLNWDGGCTDDFKEVIKKVKVQLRVVSPNHC